MILIVSTGEDLTTSDFENRLKGLIEEMNLFLSVKKLSANEIEEKKIPQGTPYIISVIG
ncbi:hypothetical protein GTO36_04995, partial [bacterium]|nr:hypothetical protein [bacterium]